MENLKRKGSRSNDERQSGNSKRPQIVHSQFPGPSSKELELPPGDGQGCCSKCKAMTGTRRGLDALLSREGYEHHNWYEMQHAAAQGCPLCEHMFEVLEHEDWELDEAGRSVTHKPTRVLARVNELPIAEKVHGMPRLNPFDGLQLLGIEVFIPIDPRLAHSSDCGSQIYHVVTRPCKSFEAPPK